MATPNSNRTYLSNGQVLSSPPLTARLSRGVDNIYNFLGLYFVSLFSFDQYAAAENSQFNTRRNPNASANRPRWSSGTPRDADPTARGNSGGSGGGSGGGGGSGSGSGPGNFGRGGRRIGTVDDVRGPECGSCG